nr:unnamed protein product [Callosobruchus chinensis]
MFEANICINSIEVTSVFGIRSVQTVAAAAYLVIALNTQRKRRKPRWWMRQLYVGSRKARSISNKWIADDEGLFRNFTRMRQEDFIYLLRKISPIVKKSDTNFREAIPPPVRLLVTLRYLATGDSYPSLRFLFQISQLSSSPINLEVCRALIDILRDFVAKM